VNPIELPEAFRKRMAQLLQDGFPAFLAAYAEPRTNGLRLNPKKVSPAAFVRSGIFALEPIVWCPDGFYFSHHDRPGQHPYHAAGVYYLQEPSAMAAVEYLDPQPGESILDLAAAPGGKSTQIASRLQGRGVLWANEIHPGRARILVENLERWGAANIIVSNESPANLARHLPEQFDRVLLDAPCSGEGMFRKDPAALAEWSPAQVETCARRQRLILAEAARMVRPGGRLVYSTCTFAPEENEETILAFLAAHPEFSPLNQPLLAPGFAESADLPGCVRIYPHLSRGEGHFVAVLVKRAGSLAPASRQAGRLTAYSPGRQGHPEALPKARAASFASGGANSRQSAPPEFTAFADRTLAWEPPPGGWLFFGEHLYLNPAPHLPLAGLKVLRPGLHLGTRKPGRFQPGHALALHLQPESTKFYLELTLADPRLGRYLRGEAWPQDGPDGWVLVGVDRFPLGWARIAQGQLKNFYPKDLRRHWTACTG